MPAHAGQSQLEPAILDVGKRVRAALIGEIQPGRHVRRGKPAVAGSVPKKNTSWRVGRIRPSKISGNIFGNQGPQQYTNVDALSTRPDRVRTSRPSGRERRLAKIIHAISNGIRHHRAHRSPRQRQAAIRL